MPDRTKKRKKNKHQRKPKHKTNSQGVNKTFNGESSSETNINVSLIPSNDSNTKDNDKKHITGESSITKIDSNEGTCEADSMPVDRDITSDQNVEYVVESPNQSVIISDITALSTNDQISGDQLLNITEVIDSISKEDELGLMITDFPIVDISNVSESESEIEWEIANELEDVGPCNDRAVILSVSQPLTVAQCEHTQPLTPAEEFSLRQYLGTLKLVTCPQDVPLIVVESESLLKQDNVAKIKLRKKTIGEDTSRIRKIPTRQLEVIAEEGSGDSTIPSQRHSFVIENKRDFGDQDDDDVFLPKTFSRLDIERFPPPVPPPRRKSKNNLNRNQKEQECKLVDTKIIETKPRQGCGSWTVESIEKMKGAELVYLTDSSSCTSTSDIYDVAEDEHLEINEQADVQIQMPPFDSPGNSELTDKTFIDMPRTVNTLSTDQSDVNLNEIIVLSTENIKTSLYVKEIGDPEADGCDPNIAKDSLNPTQSRDNKNIEQNIFKLKEPKTAVDTEINDLKRELNSVFNNLMKEVVAESDLNDDRTKNYTRQDSSSSMSSSQCTAKYNPNHSSLNDLESFVHDEPTNNHSSGETQYSHVKEVYEYVTGTDGDTLISTKTKNPKRLNILCLEKISNLPYGEEILEELASVSEKLQNINIGTIVCSNHSTDKKMPYYPLPDISNIQKVALPKQPVLNEVRSPPTPRRYSSLKLGSDDKAWIGVPTKNDPSLYVCLSPSQKMLMEKTNTFIDEHDAEKLIDAHKSFVDRRGYNEQYKKAPWRSTALADNAIPFKSQTSNRLLAILRDPSVSENTQLKYRHPSLSNLGALCSHNVLREKYEPSSVNRFKSEENISNFKDTKAFRPKGLNTSLTYDLKAIPPPRPKKYVSNYESDESSDFTDNSCFTSKYEKRYFHYSTGNLDKDVENEVSMIQNMHRRFNNIKSHFENYSSNSALQPPRRPSLPKELCDKQLQYIIDREREVESEIKHLEKQKSNYSRHSNNLQRGPFINTEYCNDKTTKTPFDVKTFKISKNRDIAVQSLNNGTDSKKDENKSVSFKSSQEELMREKMYTEYVSKIAEREQRKQHKIIKITNPLQNETKSISLPLIQSKSDLKVNNVVEEEFISKAKERWEKLGIQDPETDDEYKKRNIYQEPTLKVTEHKIKVIDKGEEKDMDKLPEHLKDFVKFTAGNGEGGKTGEWWIVVPVICAVAVCMLVVFKRMKPA